MNENTYKKKEKSQTNNTLRKQKGKIPNQESTNGESEWKECFMFFRKGI